jgi:hypothetical protein
LSVERNDRWMLCCTRADESQGIGTVLNQNLEPIEQDFAIFAAGNFDVQRSRGGHDDDDVLLVALTYEPLLHRSLHDLRVDACADLHDDNHEICV